MPFQENEPTGSGGTSALAPAANPDLKNEPLAIFISATPDSW